MHLRTSCPVDTRLDDVTTGGNGRDQPATSAEFADAPSVDSIQYELHLSPHRRYQAPFGRSTTTRAAACIARTHPLSGPIRMPVGINVSAFRNSYPTHSHKAFGGRPVCDAAERTHLPRAACRVLRPMTVLARHPFRPLDLRG
jgi:hypothetical protein